MILAGFSVGLESAVYSALLIGGSVYVAFLLGHGVVVLSLFCVVRSLKLASASVVVPYQSTLIVWSVVFGWLMFAELPDAYTVVGAAIIVAAGLYIFWREQVAAREATFAPPPA